MCNQMGILTRTMSNAMSDLMHFFVLLTLVLMMYVCMGTIIFGPTMHVRAPTKHFALLG